MQKTVLSALSALENDFVQFKNHYESHIRENNQATENRLSKMEVSLRRPAMALPDDGPNRDHQAFNHFIRKGFEGLELDHKAMISQNDNQGGFLVPPMIADLIQNKLKDLSPIRQLARVTKISANSLDLLLEKGEAEVGWVAETDPREETKTPEFVKLRIAVHEIYAKPKISQILLDDTTFDIDGWLIEKVAQKMASVENQAFLFGDGEIKPRGILSYPLASIGEGEWGKWEAILTGDPVLKSADCFMEIFHALKAQYLPGSSWLMSRKMASKLRQLKDTQGQYLWQPSLSQADPNMMLGYPVVFSDDLNMQDETPKKGEKKDHATIIFGNFHEAYQIVDRSSIHVLRDPFSAKPYVEFYTTKRVSGDVINFDALKMIRLSGD